MKLYLLVFFFLFFCERLYFRLADRYNIIDKPNERSSHTRITIRGGGVIFYIGILVFAIISRLEYPWFLAGLTLIAGISMADDIKSVPNKIRLLFHFMAMGLMFFQLGLLTGNPWWYVVVALVICTGIINAFNFMDGINGMTGGYSLAVIVPLIIINRNVGFIDERFLVIAGISVVVFCIFNFRKKAKCFAGDVGAVAIAFIILFALGKLVLHTGNVYYIVLLTVYGVDSILTICRRLYLRENIFKAHRKHAYQLLSNELKNPQLTISGAYTVIQLVISLAAISIGLFNLWYLIATISLLTIGYFTVIIFYRRKL